METAKAQLPDLNNVSYLSGRMARQRIGEAHHIERGKKHGGWHQKERKQQCVFHFLLEVWNHVEHAVARAELKIAAWAGLLGGMNCSSWNSLLRLDTVGCRRKQRDRWRTVAAEIYCYRRTAGHSQPSQLF